MRVAIYISAALAGVILLVSVPLHAHHSIANFWDISKDIEISGVVKEVRLVNPHAIFRFDVKESGSNVVWTGFGSGPMVFYKEGWTNKTLPVGTSVKVTGHPARNAGQKGILIRKIITADGKTYLISGGLEEQEEERRNREEERRLDGVK